MTATLSRRLAAEAMGTAFLLATVIGSGIMAERLAAGNAAMTLLANSLATGCGLAVLILVFAPISGAHLNPVVSLVAAVEGDLEARELLPYVAVQVIAAFAGVAAAHAMFGEPLFSAGSKPRTGSAQWLGEAIATFGLLVVILGCVRQKIALLPLAVAAYITGAYWFTSSTSFANPAVTLARAATDTFTGIRPQDAPGFMVAQLAGALAAMLFMRWLMPRVE